MGLAPELYSDGQMVRAEVFAHCQCSFISQGWVGASRVEAGAGAVVGGAAVVADERPDVGSNRAAV